MYRYYIIWGSDIANISNELPWDRKDLTSGVKESDT